MFQKKLKSQESSSTYKPPNQDSENEELSLSNSENSENVSLLPSSQTQDIVMGSVYDVEMLPHDPGKRKSISAYPLNEQDLVRKAYILRGPCQPKLHSFPQRKIGDRDRRFVVTWFHMFDWLEYSVEKDAAFCFVCYLFKNDTATNAAGGDAFVSGGGFRSWQKPDGFTKHVGKINSSHQLALQKFEALKKPQKSIIVALCLRYVDGKGRLVERFLGIVHVLDTTALSLKAAIESLLIEHSLNLSKIRGQGYDGASNMSGEINGLKSLILRENPSAYYIHCFAHQLQLTLVAVAKINDDCQWFFETISTLLNVIGVSCKRNEMLRESQVQRVAQALEDGELITGSGLNQELSLGRPGDTRWGSHHKTLMHIISLYPDMVATLLKIGKSKANDRVKAQGVLFALESFDFILMIHVMTTIFGYTHELNLALQRKDQDIINAMSFVSLTKQQLQNLRDDGWDTLFNKVLLFCGKYDIHIPKMDDLYIPRGRSIKTIC